MIPLVAASGKGIGQAESYSERSVEMWCSVWTKSTIQSLLERSASEGDSPVEEVDTSCCKRVGVPGLEL